MVLRWRLPSAPRHGIRLAVRTPAILLFLLLCCTGAQAQVQEKKLSERLNLTEAEILKMKYDVRNSTFGDRGVSTREANTKEFGGAHEFGSKSFLSKSFGGTKSSWFSNVFFKSKDASAKGKYEIPNAGTAYGTRDAATKQARESSKEMGTLAFLPGETKYLKRDRFDASPRTAPDNGGKPLGYQGKLGQMSIDDIREILNKNK